MKRKRNRWLPALAAAAILAVSLAGPDGGRVFASESAVETGADASGQVPGGGSGQTANTGDGKGTPGASSTGNGSQAAEGTGTNPAGSGTSAAGATDVTEAPTETPAEDVSSSEPAATEAPSTEAPSTEPSATEAPSTEAPSTEPPSTEPAIMEPSTEPPPTESPATEPSTEAPGTASSNSETVHLGIDNRHVYSGMEQSYADGYTPTVKNNTFTLVVPFTSSGELKDNKITVDLEFQEQDAPFEFKNYQKDVKLKTYTFETSKGQEESAAYLYQCKINLQKDAPSGQYPVTVKASGYTLSGEKVTLDYRIFVRVPEADDVIVIDPGGDEGADTGAVYTGGGGGGAAESEEILRQPKMLLESFNLSGKELEAGSEEEMEISFRNRSQSERMYNLKVTLSLEGQGISLEKNSYYFSTVGPGEEISLSNTMNIAVDAAEATVPLTFTFEYEDAKGNSSTGTEKVECTVRQPVRMELEAAELPTVLYASDTVEVSMKALNLSRTGVYNVRLSLSGTGLFPTEDVFLGNMEAGSSGEGVMRIYVGTRTMEAVGVDPGTEDAEKYGPVNGTITLEYEDSRGNVYEITKDYQAEIKKAEILSLRVTETEEANDWWISIFAVLILSLAVMILLLIWRLKRSRTLLEEARSEARHEKG